MQLDSVVTLFPDLERVEILSWIEQRWVQPEATPGGDWIFHEIDIARIRLVYDLRRDLGTAEDTVPLILSLLDQIYELRSVLKTVSSAAKTLPSEARAILAAALETAS